MASAGMVDKRPMAPLSRCWLVILFFCVGCASSPVLPESDDVEPSDPSMEESEDGVPKEGEDEEPLEEPREESGENEDEEGGPSEAVEDPHAVLMEAAEAVDAGRFGEAISLLRGVLSVMPTWSAAHLELAQALLLSGGNPEEIGQHLQEARLLGRKSARFYYLEGLLMEERGQPKMAAAAYEQAVEMRPSLLDARVRLGRLLLDEGHNEDAIIHLEAAVRIDHAFLPARANLALAYEAVGLIEEAAEQMMRIADLYPENAFHLHRLAELYERHGMVEKAREVRERAEKVKPGPDRPPMRPLLPSRR